MVQEATHEKMEGNPIKKILTAHPLQAAIVLGLLVLFFFSVFGNLAYPLLWNDEAETAMYGRRILQYGYPKVSDGKNKVYAVANHPDKSLGVKEENDAFIFLTWGQYYVAAVAEWFAQSHEDMYTKTAILRLPFVLIGLWGLILFARILLRCFPDNRQKWMVLIAFITLELLSVSLALHLREVRYYSLIIFLTAAFFYYYFRYWIFRDLSYGKYVLMMVLILWTYYQTHYTGFFIFLAFFSICEGLRFLKTMAGSVKQKEGRRKMAHGDGAAFKILMPIGLTIVAVAPFIYYFETLKMISTVSQYTPVSWGHYWNNLVIVFFYFYRYEFLLPVVFSFIFLLFLRFKMKKSDIGGDDKLFSVISYYGAFLLFYAFFIARTPTVFERYFINLQPILVSLLILTVSLNWHLLERLSIQRATNVHLQIALILGIFIFTCIHVPKQWPVWKEHTFEIRNRYQGPLDFVIPYIHEKFDRPEDLIIATNYEECSYMYYLGSRVLLGHTFNDYEKPLPTPDIISYRKVWGHDPTIFNQFLQRAPFRQIHFPVFDYPVNNIPELNFQFRHLFRTPVPEDSLYRTDLFIRVTEENMKE